MWSKPLRARECVHGCVCVCRRACGEIHLCGLVGLWVCVCVSASLRLWGCVLQHRYLMCRIVPEVKQDVCHLSPESAADTVNLVVSPQTTISGAQGYEEETYRLISPFNFNFKLVTPPTFLVWPMAQGWTHFLKVPWRGKQFGCIRGIWISLTYMWAAMMSACTVVKHVTLCRYELLYKIKGNKHDTSKSATVVW